MSKPTPLAPSQSSADAVVARGTFTSMELLVAEALRAAPLTEADAPRVRLVLAYAQAVDAAVDDPRALAAVGPKLDALLASLTAVKGSATGGSLAEFRARRTS